MDDPLQPTRPGSESKDERDRRATNIFLLVFFVVIVGAGIWLVNAMLEQRRIDDCISQGRRNCAPIDTSAH
ncbi:MAG: hypothetical protein AB7E84_12115 [Xanthobacteraceae bacterium]